MQAYFEPEQAFSISIPQPVITQHSFCQPPRLLTLEIFANLHAYYFGRNLPASPLLFETREYGMIHLWPPKKRPILQPLSTPPTLRPLPHSYISKHERLVYSYDTSQQTISCSKLDTDTQEQGLKTVQD